ncbi:MAG: hypothetical protein A2091_00290 [Desulfuromonadales bacterium GWD2_61_12]|nr:MAG: hypothetical protein A2005_12950 [Desulfuromonadales bacterium GWC2_61_20]OGR32176.1 MAG: hypothetical protein A2091_00290 [Desulfuromonadales bacterium GWD2_61_12]HAD04135.1 hypothetical protein [Desulfuromonas sp.]
MQLHAARSAIACVAVVSALLGGCSLSSLGPHLSDSLLEQQDPILVRDGTPAYLLTLDAMIAADPEDIQLLMAGAKLYSFYGSSFVGEPERARLLAKKARNYSEAALCLEDKKLCGLLAQPLESLDEALRGVGPGELPVLYVAAVSWLYSIKANSDDWSALADLTKVERLFECLLILDEAYEHGSLHAYLGTLKTLRPAALGGDPEAGKCHFQRAIDLSGGRDLGFKVDYAAGYARAVYDRSLHDQLLQDVLAADPVAPRLTLLNVLAQQYARKLLLSAEEYF